MIPHDVQAFLQPSPLIKKAANPPVPSNQHGLLFGAGVVKFDMAKSGHFSARPKRATKTPSVPPHPFYIGLDPVDKKHCAPVSAQARSFPMTVRAEFDVIWLCG